jgi:hypothetical protein
MAEVATQPVQTGDPKGEKAEEKTKEKKKEEEGALWCSWCFHKADQELLKRSKITRDIYRCENCFHLNKHCFKCKIGMAKEFPGSSEKLCASCSFAIKSWNDSPDGKTHQIPKKWELEDKWCSWCFMKDKHLMLQKRLIKKDLYQCQGCAKQTSVCKKCNDAMARESDKMCAQCSNAIKNWEAARLESENTAWKRDAWCSWCFEKTSHSMETKKFVRRTPYTCSGCSFKTVPCNSCAIGMARGGMKWDDSVCAMCSHDAKMSWESLKEKKDAILNKPRTKEMVDLDLKRDSKYKKEVEKKGLLRPFMLLVAMPPIFRNQAACFLGWTMITEDYFGDAHAESSNILLKTTKGMRTRCHKSYEKANPLASGCNWLDIISRVSETAFRKDLKQDVKMESKEVKKLANNSKERFIMDKEEEFLVELVKFVKSQMTEKQRQDLEHEDPVVDEEIKKVFMQNSGLKTKEANWYALRLLNQMLNVSNPRAVFDSSGVKHAAGMGGLLAVQILLMETPLFFFILLGRGFNMIFGSTEGRLLVPVVLIINQRLLLAAEGIKIEDYY